MGCERVTAAPALLEPLIAIYILRCISHILAMSTVQEIEQAVKALPEPDFEQVLIAVLRRARELGSFSEPRRFSDEQIAAWVDDDERGMEAFRATE